MNKIINLIALTAIILIMISTTTVSVKAQSLDAMVTELKNEGDALKREIANSNLAGTGQLQGLINKVYFYKGEISAMGGGTWAYLHDVQDALLAKIKATGKSGFTVPELAAIDSFASDVATSKQEHPSSNVFDQTTPTANKTTIQNAPNPGPTQTISPSSGGSSAESTNYTNYKDPQERFSIEYPSGWHVKSATNRFETILADFFSVNNVEGNATDVNIGIIRNDPAIKSFGLEQALNTIINNGNNRIVEPVECSKYTLDGNQACSVIYLKSSTFSTELGNPLLQIISGIGDHIYIFTYGTSKDNFDKSLPIAEHMIKSFKFGPQASS
jgi:PsbP-like protein